MTIIAVHSASEPGRAALAHAGREALRTGDDLVVVNGDPRRRAVGVEEVLDELGETAARMESAGLSVSLGHSQLTDASDAVVQIAQQHGSAHPARGHLVGARRQGLTSRGGDVDVDVTARMPGGPVPPEPALPGRPLPGRPLPGRPLPNRAVRP